MTQITFDDASRFMMQATLGAHREHIEDLARQGVEPWLENQLSGVPAQDTYLEQTAQIWQYFRTHLVRTHTESAINGEGNNPALPYTWYWRMGWWQQTLKADPAQQLRQRVAQALSELLVISDNSSLELDALGLASYYDLLYNGAFNSYADLLYAVSMHPCMGVYLSHMNNRKADPAQGIHPDENYAREVMQLFSIGLYALNPDGSRKVDARGNPIPSYDNRDIKQLARVFTGLRAANYRYEWSTSFWDPSYNGYPVGFEDGVDKTYKTVPFVEMTAPMQVDENYHDRGAKQLLKGRINLPAGQDGAREIRAAIEALVAHPNTAPFVARHLINQLVTSNPSPAYLRAVAKRFGKRGDLGAAVREVLLYPRRNGVSARTFSGARKVNGRTVQSEKLKSPLLRSCQLLRAFKAGNRSGKTWVIGDDIREPLQQHVLSSPTVFNFYKPDFAPHGPLERADMRAPEFELMTSATSISYVNTMYYWFFGEYYPAVSTRIDPVLKNVAQMDVEALRAFDDDKLRLNFSREIALAEQGQFEQLIAQMSSLLCGRADPPHKDKILHAFRNYRDNPEWVVQTVAFMLAISAEFTVQEV
ncbi:MAG: DUF1800 family protein [Pseudomonadales bacterium]